MKRATIIATALTITCGIAQAEVISVTGEVRSSLHGNLPIAGAVVEIEDTNIKTITDNTGRFKLAGVPSKGKLIFSFDELTPVKKKIKAGKEYEVFLDVYSYYDGDQLVNIGYKTETKSAVTGAITTLSEDDVKNGAGADLNASLSGKVAGVSVSSSSVDLGETSSLQVRGLNSIFAGNEPLYVVDGIPYEENPNINPIEVKAIDILKDAASCAIYGTRGAGGVILITTIKGAEEAEAAEALKKEQKKTEKAQKKEAKSKK